MQVSKSQKIRTRGIEAMKPIIKKRTSRKTLLSLTRKMMGFVLTKIKQEVDKNSKEVAEFKRKLRYS